MDMKPTFQRIVQFVEYIFIGMVIILFEIGIATSNQNFIYLSRIIVIASSVVAVGGFFAQGINRRNYWQDRFLLVYIYQFIIAVILGLKVFLGWFGSGIYWIILIIGVLSMLQSGGAED